MSWRCASPSRNGTIRLHVVDTTIPPPATDCAAHEPFALRVLGDSMEPEFPDGSIIIIDPSGVVESGGYVLAQVSEADLERAHLHNTGVTPGYIFRQFVVEGGRCFLKALNAGYATLEVAGVSAVRGVIVQKAGTRRSQVKHYT